MNSHNPCRFVVLALTVCMLASCVGCFPTHTLEFSFQPGVVPAPTLPCPVALSLSTEFTNYDHVTPARVNSYGYKVPFGPALQKYAVHVAQSVFGDVQVLDGQPPRSDAKLLLVPRVTSSDLQASAVKRVPSSGALGVQWDFNDPKTGTNLFSLHIQCESEHSVDSFSQLMNGANLTDVSEGLMTKLTSLTIQRFNASKDVQRLSGH